MFSHLPRGVITTPRPRRAEPRVLRQFTALFLVTPLGDIWRVYDCEPTGRGLRMPSEAGDTRARLFVGMPSARGARLVRLEPDDDHGLSPRSLQRLFDGSDPL